MKRTHLAYLFIVLLLGAGLRTAHAVAFTGAQASASPSTISTQAGNTTITFGIDTAASVTATFYRIGSDGSQTAVDTVTENFTAGAGKTLVWDALWLIGDDLGRRNGNYKFQLTASTSGATADSGLSSQIIVLDSVDIHGLTVIPGIDNSGNATAPFLITYALAKEARVTMTIEDSSGTVVRTMVNNQLKSGETVSSHTIVWDGLTSAGVPAPIGVYTIKVDAVNVQTGDTATQRTRTFAMASLAGISSDQKTLFEQNSYVYPNPIRDGQGIFRVQSLRNNSKLSIKIYTVSGDLVRSENFAGLNSGDVTLYSWDATNQSNRKVGRGLYLCVIREDSPEGVLQTVKKVAVIQ